MKQTNALFAKPCTCLLAAAEPEQFPLKPRLPEIAFVGRSNVGKSSLINAMMGRKTLARASKTPGRTQQIVFFELERTLMIVDLPGYGRAEAPKKTVATWNRLIGTYLTERTQLRCVLLLIDARHDPFESDIDMMNMLDDAAVNYQVVLTKIDYLKDPEREARIAQLAKIIKKHPAARPTILATSADKKLGIDDLRSFVASFVTTKI